MKSKEKLIKELLAERQKLLNELSGLSLLIKGSCFERSLVCTRKNCRCHKGKKHGPYCYLEIREGKNKQQCYVPREHEINVRHGIVQADRAHTILQRITLINIELMHNGSYGN